MQKNLGLTFGLSGSGTIIYWKSQTLIMKGSTHTTTDFALFLIGLEQKYQVAMDSILQVAAKFGYNKGKIRGYFELQSFLKNKNLPAESINTQMLNRWFPA